MSNYIVTGDNTILFLLVVRDSQAAWRMLAYKVLMAVTSRIGNKR